MEFGPVSASTKFDIKLLDHESKEDLETKLCINSQP
jgi:hypothetical protein